MLIWQEIILLSEKKVRSDIKKNYISLKEVSFVHQDYMYLIRNTVKTVILWNIITFHNHIFLWEYIFKK